MMIRITVACPEAFISDANHLAMALGFTPADGQTYQAPGWRDADGNLYAGSSFEQDVAWIGAAQSALARPAWDTDSIIDMDAVQRTHAKLVIHDATTGIQPPQATPAVLTAVIGMEGVAAMVSMGLEPLPTEDDLL